MLDRLRAAGAAVCVVLAGGYAEDVRDTVDINAATVRAVTCAFRALQSLAADDKEVMGDSLRKRQMVRVAALLFGVGSAISAVSILAPHQPQLETEGLAFVVVGSTLLTALLLTLGERLPFWTVHLWVAAGTTIVSFGLLFNGERHGGAAGGDEMYYLWVTLYAAYYLGRWATAGHLVFMAAAYTATLVAIDPGPIGPSRWLTTIGPGDRLGRGGPAAERASRPPGRRAAPRRRHRSAHRAAQPARLRGALRQRAGPRPAQRRGVRGRW